MYQDCLTDGNLALSVSQNPSQEPNRRFETKIYVLPVQGVSKAPASRVSAKSQASSLPKLVLALIAVIAMVAALVFVAHAVLAHESSTFEEALATTATQTVEVRPGDSLWALAEAYPVEGMTTQDTAELIRTWNDLESATLQPGMELSVASQAD